MSRWYRRDGSGPIDTEEMRSLKWGGNAPVAKTTVGDAEVSTVFLSLDHNWEPGGPPLIFETLVFGGKYDQEMERYPTEADALAGHKRWVAKVAEPIPADVQRLARLIEDTDGSDSVNAIRLAEHLLSCGVTVPEVSS